MNIELILGQVNIQPLVKAQAKFNLIFDNTKDEVDEIASIKLFEICYELSWKTLKKVLEAKGMEDVNNPKDIFREAAIQGYINNPEPWFVFQVKRNMTVHTYNQETANDIFAALGPFQRELDQLIQNLRQIK